MGDLCGQLGVPARVVHGGAAGADTLAHTWAMRLGLEVDMMAADWATHGLAAGPIRNQQMLTDAKPDLVVAFPGGRGTADMVSRARHARVQVAEIVVTYPKTAEVYKKTELKIDQETENAESD